MRTADHCSSDFSPRAGIMIVAVSALFLLLGLLLLALPAHATWCGEFICGNDTYTGSGTVSGQTWAQIHDDMANNYINEPHGWNYSQTVTSSTGKGLYWFPWYVYDNDMAESNLKDNYVGGGTWTHNTAVTDEGSELGMGKAMNMSSTQWTNFLNYLDECADTTHTAAGGPWGTSWVCSRNGGTITKNDVNTASDATSRLAIMLFMGAQSGTLTTTQRATLGARAVNITNFAIAEEIVTQCHDSPWNSSYQLCKWRIAGANQAWGPGAITQNGQQQFIGYHETQTQHFLAAYAYTHVSNYSDYARYDVAQFLYAMQYRGGNGSANFTASVCDKNYYMSCGSEPCTTQCNYNNSGFDDADAPRAWEMCSNVDYATKVYDRYGETLPYEFAVLRQYCTAWAARVAVNGAVTSGSTVLWNGTKGCVQIGTTGNCKTTNNADAYREMGWISNVVAFKQDASAYNTAMGYLQYYDPTNDYFTQGGGLTSPSVRGFGVYGQVRTLRSIRAATGYYDFMWSNTTFNYANWAGTISGAAVNTSAPVLTVVRNNTVTNISFITTWTTDLSTDSTVFYGTTNATSSSVVSASLVTSHTISLTGLTDGTRYYWRAQSCNTAASPSNCTNSSLFNVTTIANPDIPFDCSTLVGTGILCGVGATNCTYVLNSNCSISQSITAPQLTCSRAACS